MICYCLLPHNGQMLLILSTYLICTAEFSLLLYRISRRSALRYRIVDGVLQLFSLLLIVFLICSNQDAPPLFHIPALVPVLSMAAVLLYTAVGGYREWRRSKEEISDWSIKEAIDDLPAGLCFADSTGRVILCNRKMDALTNLLIGRHPQTLAELERALRDLPSRSGVVALGDVSGCYRFPDGRIYRFRSNPLSGEELSGYTQFSAFDETEIYRGNVKLRESNERLQQVNRKLQKMYERMADDVREKESLELKVYLHDVLGRSLLTVQDVKNSTSLEVKEKLKNLKEAVSLLASSRLSLRGTMEEARQKAAEMGVEVLVEGYIPPDTETENLVSAAVRECVTNCIRHAQGTAVYVKITQRSGILRTEITNNGKAPEHQITEGSGLSSLRRSVEASGGEMHVSHRPAFSLVLHLPRKGDSL